MSQNTRQKKEALVMFSGGRDSMLAACRLIGEGYKVRAVTFDNGHMSGVDNIIQTAQRLVARFGEDTVSVEEVQFTGSNLNALLRKHITTEVREICKEYKHLISNQAACLACHTNMVAYSIIYCLKHDIKTIGAGDRKQQGFIIELDEMRERYEMLCEQFGLELKLPVYDLVSDLDRKMELAEWGLLPKSYEGQCWLGCAMHEALNNEQIADLVKFYDNEIYSKILDTITKAKN